MDGLQRVMNIYKSAVVQDNRNPYYPAIIKGTKKGTTWGSPENQDNTTTTPATERTTTSVRPAETTSDGGDSDSRQRRGVSVNDGALSQYGAEKRKLEQRIPKTLEEKNNVKTPTSTQIGHPRGLKPSLVGKWGGMKTGEWSDIITKIDHTGLKDNTNDSGYPEWSIVGGMVSFDQFVTLELTSPLSPALDALDDAVFHIASDEKMHGQDYSEGDNPRRGAPPGNKPMSLKSPRGHIQFGKGSEGKSRVEKFPLIFHGTMDHVVDMSERRIRTCQAEARQATMQLGIAKERDITRGTRDTWGPVASAGFQTLTNIGRYGMALLGLGGQVGHLAAKVNGMIRSISSLREKTGAIVQAEALIAEKVDEVDPKTSALRRGVLADAVTSAACGTAKRITKITDALRKGKIAKELFQSVDEMNKTLEYVKDKLLDPIKMKFIMEDPNLMTDYQARGYIRESQRQTALSKGSEVPFIKGELGYAWEDTDTGDALTTVPDSITGAANIKKVKLGIAGNTYRSHAKHKTHALGMREHFLDKIQELVIKVQIPVTRSQVRPWLQLRLERELYEVGGITYLLKGGYTLFQANDRDAESPVVSVSNEEIPLCKGLTGHNFMACPKDYVKERGVCEETLITNLVGPDCLKRLYKWDVTKPYLRQVGRTTRFIAFVPKGQKMEVTCPGGEYLPWTPERKTGYVEITSQPYCVIRIGRLLEQTVITAMDKQKLVAPTGAKSLENGIKRALVEKQISWEAFHAESYSPMYIQANIDQIITGASSLTPLEIREWLNEDPGVRTVMIMTFSIVGVALTLLMVIGISTQCKRACQNRGTQQTQAETNTESCCSAEGITELRNRLTQSEIRTQLLSRQLKDLNRFRTIISNDLFRRCLVMEPRMGSRMEQGNNRRTARLYQNMGPEAEETFELLARN